MSFVWVRDTPDHQYDGVYHMQDDMRNGKHHWLKAYPLTDPSPPTIFWNENPWGSSLWVLSASNARDGTTSGYLFPEELWEEDLPPKNFIWVYYQTGKLTPTGYYNITLDCSWTDAPTTSPTSPPSTAPTTGPTFMPTERPTPSPTTSPTSVPSTSPTTSPTTDPTTAWWLIQRSQQPSQFPTQTQVDQGDGTFTGWSVEDLANNDVSNFSNVLK